MPHGDPPLLTTRPGKRCRAGPGPVRRRSGIAAASRCRRRSDGYDLSGADIAFQFRVNADGPLTEIIYFNGRRVALGDDLESIDLFTSAKPGTRCWSPSRSCKAPTTRSFAEPR